MQKTVPVEIPSDWLEDVPNEPATLQQILGLGIHEYRVQRALELYRLGAGSLGYVAEQCHLNKRDLVEEARRRGIEPAFDEAAVSEELGK